MAHSFASVIVTLALFLFSSRVHAGEPQQWSNVASQPGSRSEVKSPVVARLYAWLPTLALSLAGAAVIDGGGGLGSGTRETAAGYGLMLLGLGLGPSGGQIYADQPNHIVLRTLLCGLSLFAWNRVGRADHEEFPRSEPGDPQSSAGSDNGFGTLFLAIGVGLVTAPWAVTLAIMDLWDAPDAAKRANQRIGNLGLSPVLLRSDGKELVGLGLSGRF